jgi:hypothetical protein
VSGVYRSQLSGLPPMADQLATCHENHTGARAVCWGCASESALVMGFGDLQLQLRVEGGACERGVNGQSADPHPVWQPVASHG